MGSKLGFGAQFRLTSELSDEIGVVVGYDGKSKQLEAVIGTSF